jgi:hypothetical protein
MGWSGEGGMVDGSVSDEGHNCPGIADEEGEGEINKAKTTRLSTREMRWLGSWVNALLPRTVKQLEHH